MKIKKYLLQALAGFVYWTIGLTPYMIFVVRVSASQYWKWVSMQLIISPILSPTSVWFINRFAKIFLKERRNKIIGGQG